jgi:hypothetical protein
MKKWIAIVAITAFAIFAVVDTIRDFIANDTVHYFAGQPHRLLLIAAIGIVGGIAALLFDKLSPRLKRSVKLFAMGSAASFPTLFAVWFLFELADLPPQFGGSRIFAFMPLILGSVAALLWFEFYQIFKSRVK